MASPFADWRAHHVAFRAPDFLAARDWYVEVLDFRVIAEWDYGDIRLAFLAPPGDDDFYIELFGDGSPPPVEVRPWTDLNDSLKYRGYHHACFSVANVDRTVARLAARGAKIVLEPVDIAAIGRRIAFFADPFGNFVELSGPMPA
jgi:catechol 2,3-dioxygenase-like lactoylglutathione lyase family enzyme